jgi:hypothetical protein
VAIYPAYCGISEQFIHESSEGEKDKSSIVVGDFSFSSILNGLQATENGDTSWYRETLYSEFP